METKFRFQMVAALCFMVGLVVLLAQTRSSGVAPEVLKLTLETGTFLIVGLAIVAFSVVLFLGSFYFGKKESKP